MKLTHDEQSWESLYHINHPKLPIKIDEIFILICYPLIFLLSLTCSYNMSFKCLNTWQLFADGPIRYELGFNTRSIVADHQKFMRLNPDMALVGRIIFLSTFISPTSYNLTMINFNASCLFNINISNWNFIW